MTTRAAPASVDEYIASFPDPARKLLRRMRATIRAAAPRATERISYGIPTFDLHGPLVYYAAFATHIGFYPVPRAHPDFSEALSAYRGGKGTARFPLDEKLPLALVRRIVRFRAAENLARVKAKG